MRSGSSKSPAMVRVRFASYSKPTMPQGNRSCAGHKYELILEFDRAAILSPKREWTMQQTTAAPVSTKALWVGRVITSLAVAFLTFDGVTKVVQERHSLEGTAQLGFPESAIVGIGIALLACTVIYAIPRSTILGAVMLTGYLGGAVAANVRVRNPLFQTLFPIIFSVLVWGGVFLRDDRLHALLPLRSKRN